LVALSALRRAQARYDDAEALSVEALNLTRTSANDGTPLQLEAQTAVGRVQSDKGQYAVAAATLEEVIQRYGDDPARTADRAVAVKALADAYFYLGDMDRAARESSRALDLHRQSLGVRHPEVGQALINLGAIASVRGQLAEAERHFREATDIIQTWFGEGHPETASAMTSLGQTLRSMNRLADARDLFERARATQERVFGPLHPKTAFVYNEIGILAFMADDHPAAEAAFGRAAAAYAATHHPQEPLAVANLGSVYLRRAAYAEAEREFVRALALFKGVVPDDHLNVAISRVKLGRAILRQHRPEEARPYLEGAERVLAAQPGPESTWLKAAREDLAQLRGEATAPVGTKP
jgi:serine/threonine-protein kinase